MFESMSNPPYRQAVRSAQTDRLAPPQAPGTLGLLAKYGVITWVAVVVNALGYLRHIDYADVWTGFFAGAALLGHTAVYVLIAMVPAMTLAGVARGLGRLRSKPGARRWVRGAVYTVAIAATSFLP